MVNVNIRAQISGNIVASLKRANWLLIVLVLFLGGCGESVSLTRLPYDATILAFGDSLTHGSGVSREQSYPTVLATLSQRQVINAGVPGETTSQGLRRLPGVLADTSPQLVILELGGNDILRRQSKREAKDNLAAMVNLIRASGAEVLLVGVPEFGLIPDTAAFYHELEEELGLAAENDIVADLLRQSQYKSDAIHFNVAGYRRMAEAIHQRLLDLGAL